MVEGLKSGSLDARGPAIQPPERHSDLTRSFLLTFIGLCILDIFSLDLPFTNRKASSCRSCIQPTDLERHGIDRHLQLSLLVVVTWLSRVLTSLPTTSSWRSDPSRRVRSICLAGLSGFFTHISLSSLQTSTLIEQARRSSLYLADLYQSEL